MVPPTSVENLATKWHHLHLFKIWSSDGVTCIGSKVGHQVATFTDVANLATRLRHNALDCPIGIVSLTNSLTNSNELVSSSARVTSVKFHKGIVSE